MNKEIAISVKNVSKTFRIPHEKITSLRSAAVGLFSRKGGYEEFKALDDVSFEVKKGEFFGIIGRNGSGKSTLLKILAGIYQPDAGKIKINGMISPFLELGIGFNPELSGRDNVYLNATVLGMTKKQIDAKFDDIVKFSELERFIDQKLKNYSSGMQVRLAFSVSIHANREILLMDEVLAVGDTSFQQKCINEFIRYKKKGKTVVLVTHDMNNVNDYCDRAICIDRGKIIFEGKPSLVTKKYLEFNLKDAQNKFGIKKRVETENSKFLISSFYEKESNGMADIIDYQLLNNDLQQTTQLKSGEFFDFSFKVRFNEDVFNPVFSFAVRKDPRIDLYGVHTYFNKNPLKVGLVLKNEIVAVTFRDNIPLTAGNYLVSFGVGSQASSEKFEILDLRKNIIEIEVISDHESWGLINSVPEINIKKS